MLDAYKSLVRWIWIKSNKMRSNANGQGKWLTFDHFNARKMKVCFCVICVQLRKRTAYYHVHFFRLHGDSIATSRAEFLQYYSTISIRSLTSAADVRLELVKYRKFLVETFRWYINNWNVSISELNDSKLCLMRLIEELKRLNCIRAYLMA